MDFGFSEAQQDVQNLARQILTDQVTPEKLLAYDEYKTPRFDQSLWQQLASAGLLGVAIDEQFGGMGFGFTELALLIEELGRTIAPVPVISHAVSVALAIQQFGSNQQQQHYLPAAANGELMLTAALMESLNEDASNPLAVSAVAEGDGFIVDGAKACVPFAQTAERVLLSAKTADGVLVLLVDPKTPGVSLQPVKVTTYEPQFEMQMNQVAIAAADVLVTAKDGANAMQWIVERTTAALCAHQLGVTDQAMRMTATYTAQRQQFGVPIATFQAVGHRAANCFIDVESLRLTTYQAVSLLDSGNNASTEVQVAKIWAGDVGHRVSYAAQHLHGGTGIDRDYPLWRFCLWARHNEMMLGSSAQQLAALGQRIAAGEAFCS